MRSLGFNALWEMVRTGRRTCSKRDRSAPECTRETLSAVPNLIYIHSGGHYDRARWLAVETRGDGQAVLHLQDLCHPGRLSQLKTVTCPADFLAVALDRGTLQIATGTGYLLLRTLGEHVQLEFRGLDDVGTNKVTVLRDDLRARIETIRARPAAV